MNEEAEVTEPTEQPISKEQIEEAARQQGWSPEKGELGPLEFLARGREYRDRLYEDIKELKKENQKAYDLIAKHISTQEKKEKQAESQSIEAEIRKAADEGNSDKVIELTKKLPKETAGPDPIVEKWIATNAWFNEEPEMRADALGFYQAEVMRNGGVDNPDAILPQVEKRIRKVYQDFFQPKNPNREREAGAETQGKQTKGKKTGIGREDLTEDEKAHIDQFIALGMSEEKLLQSIHKMRRQRGQ